MPSLFKFVTLQASFKFRERHLEKLGQKAEKMWNILTVASATWIAPVMGELDA